MELCRGYGALGILSLCSQSPPAPLHPSWPIAPLGISPEIQGSPPTIPGWALGMSSVSTARAPLQTALSWVCRKPRGLLGYL